MLSPRPYRIVTGLLLLALVLSLASRAAAEPPQKLSAASFDLRCADAYNGVRWLRERYDEHRSIMGQKLAPPIDQTMTCKQLRKRVTYWRWAAEHNRKAAERWISTPANAICNVFGRYCSQAIAVVRCESGDNEGELSPHIVYASNGQYQGAFQMGSSERARYGHGMTVLEQARAAYRYFVASGRDWSPWSCKP